MPTRRFMIPALLAVMPSCASPDGYRGLAVGVEPVSSGSLYRQLQRSSRRDVLHVVKVSLANVDSRSVLIETTKDLEPVLVINAYEDGAQGSWMTHESIIEYELRPGEVLTEEIVLVNNQSSRLAVHVVAIDRWVLEAIYATPSFAVPLDGTKQIALTRLQ